MTATLDHYYAFLRNKQRSAPMRGITNIPALNPSLFPFQREVTDYLLRVGSGAAFLDTGLGKALIGLEWARVMAAATNRPALLLAPLAVGPQHEREAQKFGIDARYIRGPEETQPGINICNYERLHQFDPRDFGALVLDESSIIKSFTGKTTARLIEFARSIPYRLALTATPAPNDHMELGQHSQFLGQMDSNEMLARWFTADQREMGKYRLKKYGIESFWSWAASWARMASRPSDLGYDDAGYILPTLHQTRHTVAVDITAEANGQLIRHVDTSATAIHKEKRRTAAARAEKIAEVVHNEPTENWVVWTDTDYEAAEIMTRLPEAVEVAGRMPTDEKESKLVAFSTGNARILVTKPKIAGFGLNWQHCARTAFVGLSFSYESYYQTIRRFYRFGQEREVHAHIAEADTESIIWDTIQRKAHDHEVMKGEMVKAMRRATEQHQTHINYQPTQTAKIPRWLETRKST